MRGSVVAAAAALLGLTACGGGGASGDSACAAAMTYQDRTYQPGVLQKSPKGPVAAIPSDHRTTIGTGISPACNDQGQDLPQEKDRPVDVYRIDRYNSAAVIAVRGDVWVAEGREVPASLRHAPWLEWYMP